MVKPAHSKMFLWIFRIYSSVILKWHFREIKVVSDFLSDNRSVLLVSNHFSWWDSFIVWYLNRKYIGMKFHLLVQDSDLKLQPYFKRLGAFSVSRTSKGLYDSFIYAANLLKDENNLLVFFPQGKLYSQHYQTLEFTSGITRILQGKPNCRILMSVNLIDYYTHKKPTLSIYLKEYSFEENFNLAQFQFSYNMFLKQCIYEQDKLF